MKYEQPTCCGEHMTLFTDLEVCTTVRKDGQPSLYRLHMFDNKPERLWCRRCDNRFKGAKDEKGRIIKGAKY
jgi:hypothetical protein